MDVTDVEVTVTGGAGRFTVRVPLCSPWCCAGRGRHFGYPLNPCRPTGLLRLRTALLFDQLTLTIVLMRLQLVDA